MCQDFVKRFQSNELSYRFNKRREDFDDLRSFNDYLEEVEDIGESSLSTMEPH